MKSENDKNNKNNSKFKDVFAFVCLIASEYDWQLTVKQSVSILFLSLSLSFPLNIIILVLN